MPGRSTGGNNPQIASHAGTRTRHAALERLRQRQADVRPAVYVRRLTGNLHLVRNAGSSAAYRAAAVVGANFSPGQAVLLASHAGHAQPGELILSGPPPGQLNSGPGVTAATRTLTVGPTPAAVGSYLAVSFEDGGNFVYAYHYDAAGAFVQQIGSLDLSALGASSATPVARDSTKDRVLLQIGTSLVVWDVELDSSGVYTLEGTGGDATLAAFISGSTIYYGVDETDTAADLVSLFSLDLDAPASKPHTLEGTIDGGAFSPTVPKVQFARLNAAGLPVARCYDTGAPTGGDDEFWCKASEKVGAAHDFGSLSESSPGALVAAGWLYFQATYGRGAGSSASDRSVVLAKDDGSEVYLWPSAWTAAAWTDPGSVTVSATPDGTAYLAFRNAGAGADGELVRGSTTVQGTGDFPAVAVTAPPVNPRPQALFARS